MYKFFNALVVLALVLVTAGTVPIVQAQDTKPSEPVVSASSAVNDVLLLFTYPKIEPGDIPPLFSPDEAPVYAARLIERQALQIRPELQQYRQAGQISGFSVKPEQAGIVVQVKDPAVLGQLAQLPGILGVYPAAEAGACSAQVAKGLEQVLISQSFRAPDAVLAPASANITDPSIQISHMGGSTYGNVSGTTIASTTVTLRILRNGAVAGTGKTTSNPDGTYAIYTQNGACDPAMQWSVLDNDIVEVTAHGSVSSAIVNAITAWVDPVTNKVTGVTTGASTVKIVLATHPSNYCATTYTTQSTSSDAAGNFEKVFADFDRLASATVSVEDANGNITYTSFGAFSFNPTLGSGNISFRWKIGETVHATLMRSSSVIWSSDWTLPAGYSYGLGIGTGQSLQAGDILNLSSAIGSMSYTMAPFSLIVDPAADSISGSTAAGRKVAAYEYKSSYLPACSTTTACLTTTADGAGAYSLSTPIGPGDYASGYSIDAEGNTQYSGTVYTPGLITEIQYDDVGIAWPNTKSLTVTLKDSGGVTKQTLSVSTSSPTSVYWWYFSSQMVAGDKIEVTDGTISASMTVQNIAAKLAANTGHLTGTSANGHLKASLYDFRGAMGGTFYSCQETQVTNGSFDLANTGYQIGPQDYDNLSLAGADGYYNNYYARAFKVNIGKANNYVWGYTETPGAQVNISVWRNGTQLTTQSVISNNLTSQYNYDFDTATIGSLQVGDTVKVAVPSESNSADLVIPTLSIAADAAGHRLYGVAPAGQGVSLWINYRYNPNSTNWWLLGSVLADGAGNYSLASSGNLSYNCTPILAGGTCIGGEVGYYYPTKENVVWIDQYPANVAPDSLESDNSFGTAQPYSGVQTHTFDTMIDEDWVKFTVSQADMDNSRRFRLVTFNLGPGMDTKLELYAPNGATLLTSNDNYAGLLASQILWKPASAGTYYVRVLPYNSTYTQYCGAFYSLRITNNDIMIPMVRR
jgi:hypothetical protein